MRHQFYFVVPVFHKAPTSCIIRKEVFVSSRGFSGKWMVGDVELWHKLSRTYNVLLMPMGIVWSRMHDEQESKKTRDSSSVLLRYSVVEMEGIKHENCPLTESQKKLLITRIRRSQSRSILRSLIIEKNIKTAKEKMKMCNLTLFGSLINGITKRV